MKAVLVSAGRPESMVPVTSGRDIGDCLVANHRLADWLTQRCLTAGLEVDPAADPGHTTLFVRTDAWVAPASLMVLAHADADQALRTPQGDLLAWRGTHADEPPADTPSLSVNERDCRIKFPWQLLDINAELLDECDDGDIDGECDPRAVVDGTLLLGEGSRVLPGVYIEGAVAIGRDCKIGPNCYIRGRTAIGDGCHIGQAVEIKNSIIMPGASIGHLSYCGDSVVGESVNFGAGTITANFRHDGKNHRSMVGGELLDTGRRKLGAIIGDGVHTGIHTAIYPGRKLWPHTSTRPGDIVQKDLQS